MPYALFFKAQASGIAEVVKYGLIKDGEFFEWQESCMEKMAARDEMVLAEAVERSCVNKAKVRGSRGGGRGEAVGGASEHGLQRIMGRGLLFLGTNSGWWPSVDPSRPSLPQRTSITVRISVTALRQGPREEVHSVCAWP